MFVLDKLKLNYYSLKVKNNCDVVKNESSRRQNYRIANPPFQVNKRLDFIKRNHISFKP